MYWKLHKTTKQQSLESSQVGEHIEVLEGWHAQRGHGNSTHPPSPYLVPISSIWLFLSCILSFIYFIYYFWLHWVFVAARGLSLVAVSGTTLWCGAWASHCGGFSCGGAWALGAWASVVVACGLSSYGSRALEHRLSSCGTQA